MSQGLQTQAPALFPSMVRSLPKYEPVPAGEAGMSSRGTLAQLLCPG